MKTMELKHLPREVAMEARVICVPGSTRLVSDETTALEVASRIGYPVMLKASAASAAGRGMGMFIFEDEGALRDAFTGVTRAQRYVCTRLTELAVGGC
jgi:acetyl-CoA carboxylase biotin carboxylase subunit